MTWRITTVDPIEGRRSISTAVETLGEALRWARQLHEAGIEIAQIKERGGKSISDAAFLRWMEDGGLEDAPNE